MPSERRIDGLLIRPVRVEDVPALNELRRLPSVLQYTLALPSERISDSARFIESLGPNDHQMVAEVNGRVVGTAGMKVFTGKMRHVGHLGICVHDDFQNQGLGRALLEALLNLADNYLNLVRVELEVNVDNARAIHLYESLGFEREGLKRMAVFSAGRYTDFLIMGRIRPAQ